MTDGVAAAVAAPVAATAATTVEVPAVGGNALPVERGVVKPEPVLSEADKKVKEAEAIQVAAAQAQKAKDAEAAKAAEVIPAPNADTYSFKKIGDPGVDAALDMLKSKGLTSADAVEAFGKFMQSGNPADLNMQFLVNKVGEGMAAVVAGNLKAYAASQVARHQGLLKTADEVAGGEGKWAPFKDWFHAKEKSDPAFAAGDAKEIREMFMKGGRWTVAAAKDIMDMYSKDPNTSGANNGKLVKPAAGQTIGETLTRQEFTTQLRAAEKKGDTATADRLRAVRRASRSAGIQ